MADLDLEPQADSGLVDRIYEAAFVPDLWPDVLGEIGTLSAAPAGAPFVFDGKLPIGIRTPGTIRAIIEDFVASGEWQENQRLFQQKPFTGFVIAQDYYPPEFLAAEPTFQGPSENRTRKPGGNDHPDARRRARGLCLREHRQSRAALAGSAPARIDPKRQA